MRGYRARAYQWSRTALALAALFGSLPLVSRIVLGSWAFEGAGGIAFVCLLLGTYWHLVSRRYRTLPDPATRLEEALGLARAGQVDDAIVRLSAAIRVDPELWQAYQYRGELYLMHDSARAALADFEAAIRLAPGEPHLQNLRDRAREAIEANSGS